MAHKYNNYCKTLLITINNQTISLWDSVVISKQPYLIVRQFIIVWHCAISAIDVDFLYLNRLAYRLLRVTEALWQQLKDNIELYYVT